MAITSPRLALARDVMRVAMLHTHVQGGLMEISHEIYRMSDDDYESRFLDMVARRDALLAQNRQRQEVILNRMSGNAEKDSAA